MAKSTSSDFVSAEELLLLEVLNGNQGEDLEQLDAKFAEQLQFQDAILLSVKDKSMKPSSSQMNGRAAASAKHNTKPRRSSKKETGQSSLSYCEICVERKERRKMFPNSACSHSFCSDCISMHVKTRLEQNVTIIMCPGENCRVMFELESCRSLLPKDVISLWEDLLCEELLCATGGRLYCPFKDCSALLLNDNEAGVIRECECPFCHRLFCAKCHVPWHFGIDCEEYQKLNEDERGRDDIMVRNLAKENKWPRCPSCHYIVERTEGCLHMTCRCKLEFCYACGAEWTPDHGGCQRNQDTK